MVIDYNYLHGALDRVEHTSTVEFFHYQFQTVKSLLAFVHPEIPEYYYANRFVYGLQADYQNFVFRFQPTTILAAYKLALIFEESLYLDYFPEIELITSDNYRQNNIDNSISEESTGFGVENEEGIECCVENAFEDNFRVDNSGEVVMVEDSALDSPSTNFDSPITNASVTEVHSSEPSPFSLECLVQEESLKINVDSRVFFATYFNVPIISHVKHHKVSELSILPSKLVVKANYGVSFSRCFDPGIIPAPYSYMKLNQRTLLYKDCELVRISRSISDSCFTMVPMWLSVQCVYIIEEFDPGIRCLRCITYEILYIWLLYWVSEVCLMGPLVMILLSINELSSQSSPSCDASFFPKMLLSFSMFVFLCTEAADSNLRDIWRIVHRFWEILSATFNFKGEFTWSSTQLGHDSVEQFNSSEVGSFLTVFMTITLQVPVAGIAHTLSEAICVLCRPVLNMSIAAMEFSEASFVRPFDGIVIVVTALPMTFMRRSNLQPSIMLVNPSLYQLIVHSVHLSSHCARRSYCTAVAELIPGRPPDIYFGSTVHQWETVSIWEIAGHALLGLTPLSNHYPTSIATSLTVKLMLVTLINSDLIHDHTARVFKIDPFQFEWEPGTSLSATPRYKVMLLQKNTVALSSMLGNLGPPKKLVHNYIPSKMRGTLDCSRLNDYLPGVTTQFLWHWDSGTWTLQLHLDSIWSYIGGKCQCTGFGRELSQIFVHQSLKRVMFTVVQHYKGLADIEEVSDTCVDSLQLLLSANQKLPTVFLYKRGKQTYVAVMFNLNVFKGSSIFLHHIMQSERSPPFIYSAAVVLCAEARQFFPYMQSERSHAITSWYNGIGIWQHPSNSVGRISWKIASGWPLDIRVDLVLPSGSRFMFMVHDSSSLYTIFERTPKAQGASSSDSTVWELCVEESSSGTINVRLLLSGRSHILKYLCENSQNDFYQFDSYISSYNIASGEYLCSTKLSQGMGMVILPFRGMILWQIAWNMFFLVRHFQSDSITTQNSVVFATRGLTRLLFNIFSLGHTHDIVGVVVEGEGIYLSLHEIIKDSVAQRITRYHILVTHRIMPFFTSLFTALMLWKIAWSSLPITFLILFVHTIFLYTFTPANLFEGHWWTLYVDWGIAQDIKDGVHGEPHVAVSDPTYLLLPHTLWWQYWEYFNIGIRDKFSFCDNTVWEMLLLSANTLVEFLWRIAWKSFVCLQMCFLLILEDKDLVEGKGMSGY